MNFSVSFDNNILVEGLNDKKALEYAGFTNVVFLNRPIYEIVEQFDKKDIVQLCFDDDAKGRELLKRFIHEFAQRGVIVRTDLREEILDVGVTQIEDLYSYLQRRS